MRIVYSCLCRIWLFLFVLLTFCGNIYAGSIPPHREIPWSSYDDMAFREPINILVIGEPKSGKSKVTASILRNLKIPEPNLKVTKYDIEHSRIYASLTRDDVRVVELNVDEFLNLEALDRDAKYLIENISWVFYVCNKDKCNLANLLSVYNKINQVYCDKYGVEYKYHHGFPASKQSDDWFIELQWKKKACGTYCKFILIVNSKEEESNKKFEKFKEEFSHFLNGREIYYVRYPDDGSIPLLPDELLDIISGRVNATVVPPKDVWSHENYFSGKWSQLWRGIIKFFAQQYRSWPSECWSYDRSEPKFLKNQQGTEVDLK